MNAIIKPISETEDTVTFSKEAWVSFLEDAADRAAVERSEARRAAIGPAESDRLAYTSAEVDRILDDDVSVVTIWREREGLTQRALAEKAGISTTYLCEIEAGKKPGSVVAIKALAAALQVPMEHLA